MTVTFDVILYGADGPLSIGEDALLREPDSVRRRLGDVSAVEGTIHIVATSGEFHATDTLASAIQNLSFAGVAAVLDNPKCPYVYTFTESDHHVILLPLADLVRVFAEGEAAVTDEAAVLLPDLYKCGLRFLTFLADLGEQGAGLAAYLQPQADRARETLEKHNLI